jgi:hypothetical protein
MKKFELRQLIKEEIQKINLNEYSFKTTNSFGTQGYINSDNFVKIFQQMSKHLTGNTTDFSWISQVTEEDYKNLIKLIAKSLSNKNPNLNGDISFS